MAEYTLDQVQKLREAISLGALSVEYADKKVTYRSLKEMKQILSDMESSLGVATGAPKSDSRLYAKFSKGT